MACARNRRRLRNGLLGALMLSVGAGTATLLTIATGADAATPMSGTVTDAARSVSWTGGPFTVPNPTGNALDMPDCTVPASCDDFLLHVNTPAQYEDTHQLTISVGWPNTAADFDVYVLDPDGSAVGTAASGGDPEVVVIDPVAGDYTVRVVPFAPLGQSYSATATLGELPANPPPGKEAAPTFTNYPAPKALPNSNNAGEPSIGNSFRTGATFLQSYLSTYKATWKDGVVPAKDSWADVSASVAKGCAAGSTPRSLDPILFTDRVTGRTFESQLTGVNSATCYTDDDGKTWAPSTGGGIPSGVDHQTIGGGSYNATTPASGYPHSVYYCSQDIATAFCASSINGGTTFGPGVPTYDLTQCGGLHGHVKVGPDGTAYLPNKSCGSAAAVAVSSNDGGSWQVHPVTGSSVGASDPSVGISANNTVYFGYVGANGKPAVATSTDHGATWRGQQTVGTEFHIKNAVFPTMVAGDDDRAALAYLGTPTGGNSENISNFTGVWHLYVSYTYDGGRTWVTSDATPDDPVQRGSICTGGTTCGDDRNLLDFNDVTLDEQGRVLVAYADGCIDACVSDPTKNNRDAYATIARQSGGMPLFSRFDKVVDTKRATNLKVGRVRVIRKNGSFVATLTIKNTGRTAVRKVGTLVKDNGRKVGVAKLKRQLLPGHRKRVTIRWRIDRHRLRHHVLILADYKHLIAEFNERDNRRRRNLRLS